MTLWKTVAFISVLPLFSVFGLTHGSAQAPPSFLTGNLNPQHVFSDRVFSLSQDSLSMTRPESVRQRKNVFQKFDASSFTPFGSLSSLSEESFASLTHPAVPGYGVRVKKSKFCDGAVSAYTGYVDIDARHLFFYFFESRSDPDKDDVIFWTNGGPGGSSSLGLFMENGPCRITNATAGPTYHPESWNSNANIFFIDQPVGVGFSYAEHGEETNTSEDAGRDIAAFVSIFFEHFSSLKGRAFHMSGESYGGRYVPMYASAVYDYNAELEKAGLTAINLQSLMIGNGMTDAVHQVTSIYDMLCTPASMAPLGSIGACMQLKQLRPRCETWIEASCVDLFDAISCTAAWNYCSEAFGTLITSLNLNVYDMSKACTPEQMAETLCYDIMGEIQAYLSNSSVAKSLGAEVPYTMISWRVNYEFIKNLDHLHPTQYNIAALLDRGVDVLVYVGNYDLACDWVGNEKWTSKLEWSGGDAFRAEGLREWKVNGKRAGLARGVEGGKGLTFATIDGAGHMVPYDKPKESLELVNRWLKSRVL